MFESGKNLMPFMGVDNESMRTLHDSHGKERHFRIFTYQAYNACGLIGTEYNGVAVCDEDNKCVVTDRMMRDDSCCCTPSEKQVALVKKLTTCSRNEFIQIINESERLRRSHWL